MAKTSEAVTALGFAEVPFWSIGAVVADKMVKEARVTLLGLDTTALENILIRVAGDVSDVKSSLQTAIDFGSELGVEVITGVIPSPESGFDKAVDYPNSINPIYGAREQFLPSDYKITQKQNMNDNQHALGFLETQGLVAVLEATDAMLKSANVTLVGKEKIGAAYVTVVVKGDVAAVTAAVDAGKEAVNGLGTLIASHVIARPHADLVALLPA